MRTVTDRGLLIILSLSFVVSIFASAGIVGDAQATGPTYTSHSAIHINNNGELDALISSNGWPGSGLVGDPYVISGYDITGTGGTCIYIGNTTRYLVVSDCLLHGNNAGIELIGAVHVTVSNNICSGNAAYGIHTSAASHSIIKNNTLTGAGRDDMFFQDSNNNIIQNNTSTGSGHCSNWLSNSNNNTFSNNTSTGSYSGCGLQIQSSDYNTVTNNTLTGNAEFGIRLFDSSNHNTVVHNLCGGNEISGIGLTSANNNSLLYNICSGNTLYGISQYSSSGNAIYGNELTENNGASSSFVQSHVQAYDDGKSPWNSLSFGNFWGDWTTPDAGRDGIVDHPYPISGAGAKDNLPTVSCQGPHFIIDGPSQAMKGENVSWSFQVRNDGKAKLLNVIVLDPSLNKTWSLGDVASGASKQWSYLSAIPSYLDFTNIAYATATDVYGGTYNVSYTHSITVLPPVSAPQGLTISVRDGGAILNWNAPATTSQPISDYRIFRGTSSGSESYQGDTGSGTTLRFNDTGLINGRTYYYRVSAVCLAGEGPQCSETSAIPLGPPSAPRNLQATAGNGLVDLKWTAPSSDGGAAIDHYIVYENGADVMHVTSISAAITGLNNGQIYSFTVCAHNSVNAGPQTLAVSATPVPSTTGPSAPTVPGIPTNLIATPGNAQVSLSWMAPANNGGAAVDHYIVYRDGVDVAHPIAASSIIAYLVDGRSYNFTVAAHNSAGIGTATSAVSATPSASATTVSVPGAVTDVKVTTGVNKITLDWTLPSTGGTPNAILVYVSTSNSIPSTPVANLSSSATEYVYNNAVNGTTYYCWIVPGNSAGNGESASSGAITAGAVADPGNGSSDNTMLLAGIGIVVVIAAIGAVFVLKRKKPGV